MAKAQDQSQRGLVGMMERAAVREGNCWPGLAKGRRPGGSCDYRAENNMADRCLAFDYLVRADHALVQILLDLPGRDRQQLPCLGLAPKGVSH